MARQPVPFRPYYDLLVDLGTTSIVAGLMDPESGGVLKQASNYNPQSQWGMEVMSRITAIQRQPQLLETMQGMVLAAIKGLAQDLAGPEAEIRQVYVAGNSVMNHILMGQSPVSLGRAPYSLGFQTRQEANIQGLHLVTLPNISAFVGGDIVAGILTSALYQPGPTRLFIDVGTNGELVLAQGDRLLSTSCAAGPALEGMNIQCGMLAQAGAICEADFSAGQVQVQTIDDQPIQGICGSGILALVREGLKAGLIDYRGRLVLQEGFQVQDKRLYLDSRASFFISQKDIRQIQLAKGAIRAAINCLLEAAGLQPQDLDQVFISGQFGSFIQPETFTRLGMLPPAWQDKIHYLGNAALKGCQIFARDPQVQIQADRLVQKVHQVNLTSMANFDRIFAQALLFPKGDFHDPTQETSC